MTGDSCSPGKLSFKFLAYIQLQELQCLSLLCANVCREFWSCGSSWSSLKAAHFCSQTPLLWWQEQQVTGLSRALVQAELAVGPKLLFLDSLCLSKSHPSTPQWGYKCWALGPHWLEIKVWPMLCPQWNRTVTREVINLAQGPCQRPVAAQGTSTLNSSQVSYLPV